MASSEEGKLAFARVVKLWLRENGWPQKITDDWARDPGVMAPNGPWASQICAALKAEFHPRVEFFLALGRFNQVVADGEIRNVTDSKLRTRLAKGKPLTDDSGKVYGAAEFFALMSGLSDGPTAYIKPDGEFSEEDAAQWTALMRQNFKEVCLQNMCSRADGWELVEQMIYSVGDKADEHLSQEDVDWAREVLAGLHDPSAEELVRVAKRHARHRPLEEAMGQLLGDKAKKMQPVA